MLIVALYFQPLGIVFNNSGIVRLRLTRKAFVFLCTYFLEMKKYSIYSGLILNFGDLGS